VIGIFDGKGDVGTVLHTGSADFDLDSGSYSVSGSGVNMWSTTDAFYYLWKEVDGDVALTADIKFPEPGVEPHRKAALIIRQSLDAGSAYADAALHGDGLTSLQFRNENGGATHEVQANITAPKRLRIEKRGKYVLMFLGDEAGNMRFSGAATRIEFEEPFYIGLGVCSHNDNVLETAVFSSIAIDTNWRPSLESPVLYSTLETQSLASTDRCVCHVTDTHIEAPNWLPDNSALVYNSGGRILRIPVRGGTPETIDTDFAVRCNNDHGVSPDGTLLVVSDQSQADGRSLIYTLPIHGGTPKLITELGPSYWHGWSPDGSTLTYCAQRDGSFGIFTIPAEGGTETRLTTAPGLDDGPE
jgi:TolB protein